MRAIKPNMRHRSLWRTVLLALVAIVIGGAGTVAALAVFKVIDPAKLAFWRTKKDGKSDPHGLDCRSPVRSTDSRLRRWSHSITWSNPKTATVGPCLQAAERRAERSHPGTLKDPWARHGTLETRGGYAFTESDFLPLGTRPGVVGGTPQGKRAYHLGRQQTQGRGMT